MALTFREDGAKEGKSQNANQRLASTENFSIFLIKGMLGNLTKLKQCATVPQSSVLSVENTLRAIEKKIKLEQGKRKQARKVKDNG